MATQLYKSPHFQAFSAPKRSYTTNGSYILAIKSLPNHYAAACSAPLNAIQVYDRHTLQPVQQLPGHENATTSLTVKTNVAALGTNVASLVSSGKDGSVKVWDTRTNSHSIKMTDLGKSRPLLCCDVSADGLTVAAGTELQGEDALILYWDPRQPAAPIRTHSSTHSDDITVVSFKPTTTTTAPPGAKVMLSASSDGLLSTSNAEESDEDEAVISVGNFGCSVAQAGWIPPPASASASTTIPRVWASSDMETFSTWSEELSKYQDVDIRSPAFHGGQGNLRTWVTDYLIGCQPASGGHGQNPDSVSGLHVFVGSNEGDASLLTNANLTTQNAPWYIHSSWTRNHVGVVRSILWDEDAGVVVTGGEDFKLAFWDAPVPRNVGSFSLADVGVGQGNEYGGEEDGDGMDVDDVNTGRKRNGEEMEWDGDEMQGKRRKK